MAFPKGKGSPAGAPAAQQATGDFFGGDDFFECAADCVNIRRGSIASPPTLLALTDEVIE